VFHIKRDIDAKIPERHGVGAASGNPQDTFPLRDPHS
jgi:hypothetical protein